MIWQTLTGEFRYNNFDAKDCVIIIFLLEARITNAGLLVSPFVNRIKCQGTLQHPHTLKKTLDIPKQQSPNSNVLQFINSRHVVSIRCAWCHFQIGYTKKNTHWFVSNRRPLRKHPSFMDTLLYPMARNQLNHQSTYIIGSITNH